MLKFSKKQIVFLSFFSTALVLVLFFSLKQITAEAVLEFYLEDVNPAPLSELGISDSIYFVFNSDSFITLQESSLEPTEISIIRRVYREPEQAELEIKSADFDYNFPRAEFAKIEADSDYPFYEIEAVVSFDQHELPHKKTLIIRPQDSWLYNAWHLVKIGQNAVQGICQDVAEDEVECALAKDYYFSFQTMPHSGTVVKYETGPVYNNIEQYYLDDTQVLNYPGRFDVDDRLAGFGIYKNDFLLVDLPNPEIRFVKVKTNFPEYQGYDDENYYKIEASGNNFYNSQVKINCYDSALCRNYPILQPSSTLVIVYVKKEYLDDYKDLRHFLYVENKSYGVEGVKRSGKHWFGVE